jgi:hypothetical protein
MRPLSSMLLNCRKRSDVWEKRIDLIMDLIIMRKKVIVKQLRDMVRSMRKKMDLRLRILKLWKNYMKKMMS